MLELYNDVKQQKKPVAHFGHFLFHDFTWYVTDKPEWRPIWINVVREPISRVESLFHYSRTTMNLRKKPFKDFELVGPYHPQNISLDECMLTQDPWCADRLTQLQYFCGTTFDCKKNTPHALAKAKYNAEHHFAVIGLTEDTAQTIALLEFYLPRYFKGAGQFFNKVTKEVSSSMALFFVKSV